MVDLNISLPESFLQEEVRDGYLVSAKMKALWAIQLDLLNEFDRVCKKYDLRYILEFGTLLGAIRHKGFIPWDDDLDVSMLREDYDKLMAVASKEFKHPYFLQNQMTESGYDDCVTKLRRSDTCYILKLDIDKRGRQMSFNQGVFIDIFVFDNAPSDKKTEELLDYKSRRAFYRMKVINRPPRLHSDLSLLIKEIMSYSYNRLRYGSIQKEYMRLEKIAKSFHGSDTVGTVMTLVNWFRPLSFYDELIKVPFENLTCPVPSRYDEVLRTMYGDYMTPVIAPSGHTLVYFDADRSYQEVLNDKSLMEELRRKLDAKS